MPPEQFRSNFLKMVIKNDIILHGPEDWTEWVCEFETKAKAMKLWDCIKENPKKLLNKPIKPNSDKYKTKTPGAFINNNATISTQLIKTDSIINLTFKKSRNFQIAWNTYMADKKEY